MTAPILVYAVRELGASDGAGEAGAEGRRRPSRAVQSAAAQSLLEALGASAGLDTAGTLGSSKSHCRTWVAAALGGRPGLKLGVDLEYDLAGRSIAEIAALYLGEAPAGLDARAFYRAWTVGEAWVKAFGVRPDRALLRRIIDGEVADRQAYRLGEAGVLHETVAPGLLLSLVWSPPSDAYAAPVRLLG